MAAAADEQFEREYGCTEEEWRGWLPSAVHGHAMHDAGARALRVQIDAGDLHLSWQPLAPRTIALLRLPRMTVRFRFQQVGAPARAEFLRRFDLRLQRGGG